MARKYYKDFGDAKRACATHNLERGYNEYEVHKQPRGTRHHGMYYVGTYLDWLNFAN